MNKGDIYYIIYREKVTPVQLHSSKQDTWDICQNIWGIETVHVDELHKSELEAFRTLKNIYSAKVKRVSNVIDKLKKNPNYSCIP